MKEALGLEDRDHGLDRVGLRVLDAPRRRGDGDDPGKRERADDEVHG